MADIPCESDHGSVLGIHYRVLNDVGLTSFMTRQELLCPARQSAGFGQEPPRNEAVIGSHLPKHYVFSQNMITETRRYRGLHRAGRPLLTSATNQTKLLKHSLSVSNSDPALKTRIIKQV